MRHRRESGNREGGRGSRGPGDDAHGKAGAGRRFDQVFSRIGEPGHAGIGNESDCFSRLEALEQLRDPSLLTRSGAGQAGPMETEARGELARDARVLAEDRVRLGQRAQRPRGKVFEVPDRRSDDEQLSPFSRRAHELSK